MVISKVENYTLSELVDLYKQRTEQMYEDYKRSIRGLDEDLKDASYRRWSHADDCLIHLNKVIEMVRSDNVESWPSLQ